MSNILKKPKAPWGSSPNSLLWDREISLKAKGLYCFMESKPNDWNFTAGSMSKQLKESRKTILAAMAELKDFGFLSYKKLRDGSGQYELLRLYLEPKSENDTMASESQSPIPARCKNDTVSKTDCINKNDSISKNDLNNKNDISIKAGSKNSQLKEITDFIPNRTSAERIQIKFEGKLSDQQIEMLIDDFKAQMTERTIKPKGAAWVDLQSQFRSYISNEYIKPVIPSKIPTATSSLGYEDIGKIIADEKRRTA